LDDVTARTTAIAQGTSDVNRPGIGQTAYFVKAVVAGSLAVYLVGKLALAAVDPQTPIIIGETDAWLYREAGHRILAGGPVYPAFQLEGPYSLDAPTIDRRPELYPPPTMLLLVAPMSALPAFLWWLVPLAILAAVVVRHRPSLTGWAVILACLAWPTTGFVILAGNPVIWAAAFVALGTIWKGAAVLSMVKPSLAPFALVGARSRSWWLWAAAYGAVALVMLPLWFQWATVLRNAQGIDLAYSLGHVPIMLVGVAAARWRRSDTSGLP
jgi:hypothetical protein